MSELPDHLFTQQVPCISVQVESLEMLQNIEEWFTCTIDENYELIFDCFRIEEKDEQAEMRKLLKVPEDTKLPDDGYIVFWR